MKSGHWTFLYVPEGEGGVKTLHLNRRLVTILAATVGVFLLLVGLVTWSFLRQGIILHDAKDSEREIYSLREKISNLESKVGTYEAQMGQNFELLERANLLAGLGPLDDTVIQMGVGGHETPRDLELEALQPMNRQRIQAIQTQAEKLLRQARFQRESYERVIQALQNDQIARDSTPSTRPLTRGYMSSRYGRRIDPFTGESTVHRGLDFSAPIGTPVYATASGEVIRASRKGKLGKLIEIDHGNGFSTRYGHLNAYAVEKDAEVKRGDIIGYVGNTGKSTGPHVHYEVVKEGKSANPWLYIIRD